MQQNVRLLLFAVALVLLFVTIILMFFSPQMHTTRRCCDCETNAWSSFADGNARTSTNVKQRLFFVFTTSLIEKDFEIRKEQYSRGLSSLYSAIQEFQLLESHTFSDVTIVVTENNGSRETFLDTLPGNRHTVHYTASQKIPTDNKGTKELTDVLECIDRFSMNDNDFLVKMTGRYHIQSNSPFMRELQRLSPQTDAILRYGDYMTNDKKPRPLCNHFCHTGLIGMRVGHVREIEMPGNTVSVETRWAKMANSIPADRVIALEDLGLLICPNSNTYFLV